MSRKVVVGMALSLGFVLLPLATDAQQPVKVARIGVLWSASESAGAPLLEAFRQGLRDLGYVEGKNVAFEYRWAEGKPERHPEFAAELVRLKVDIIVAGITGAAQAAKDATRTIPIVMVTVPDPVGSGLVGSLARPGGNITGLSMLAVDLAPKQLQLLKEAVPKVSRVAVLSNRRLPGHLLILRELELAAPRVRLTLQILEVRGPEEFEGAFAAMKRDRAGALLVLPDPLSFSHRARVAELAAKHRLPAMYGIVDHADAGGLMAYAVDVRHSWRRAATFVDKILKGAKPADLPVEQPTRMEFVINLKTAKALGLRIPQSVLIRADRVIQ
jgi:putative ABC transport system substrate-binding protein